MMPPSMQDVKYLVELGSMWPNGPDLSWEGSGMGGLREEVLVVMLAVGALRDGMGPVDGLLIREEGPWLCSAKLGATLPPQD